MIKKGPGIPTTQPATRTFFLPIVSAGDPETRFEQAFTIPEETMNEEDRRAQHEPELLRAQKRHHGALQAHHADDEGVDEHQEGELPQVLPQA